MKIGYILKVLFKEFVFGGHMTALEATAMILSVIHTNDLTLTPSLMIIPYLVTQLIYSYNNFREVDFDIASNPERSLLFKSSNKRKKLQFLGYSILLLMTLIFTNWSVILLIILILIAGFLYTEYFKKLKIPGFKNFYVSLIWVLIILIVPLSQSHVINLFYFFIQFIYFLTVITNTIFFDVKDIESDTVRGIKTFPVVIGKQRTLYLLYVMKILTFAVLITGIYLNILPKEFLFYIIPIIYSFIYITIGFNLDNKNLRLISYLVADAEFIFWSIILILVSLQI